MKKRRIVVTGMGGVSCFGTDVNVFYKNLLEGKSGVRAIDAFDCSEYPTRFAADIQDFSVEGYMEKKQARRVDPFIRYVMVAGKKAIEDASLGDDVDKKKVGVIVGSGMGGMSVFYDGVNTLLEKSYRRLTPFFIPYIITNMGVRFLRSTKDLWARTTPFPPHAQRPIIASLRPLKRFAQAQRM